MFHYFSFERTQASASRLSYTYWHTTSMPPSAIPHSLSMQSLCWKHIQTLCCKYLYQKTVTASLTMEQITRFAPHIGDISVGDTFFTHHLNHLPWSIMQRHLIPSTQTSIMSSTYDVTELTAASGRTNAQLRSQDGRDPEKQKADDTSFSDWLFKSLGEQKVPDTFVQKDAEPPAL